MNAFLSTIFPQWENQTVKLSHSPNKLKQYQKSKFPNKLKQSNNKGYKIIKVRFFHLNQPLRVCTSTDSFLTDKKIRCNKAKNRMIKVLFHLFSSPELPLTVCRIQYLSSFPWDFQSSNGSF